ncbi:c-type cytochrome [Pseudoponticoccus marisrubri]|uniref:Cytochrome C n=1 Tax=Pseudoponticoccus marisrubri TaxID=1685382 RepID=A0A0W7WFS2_9RHOB|nr:cytochrome c [Pseudoponticoccus marisrubri]KUF09491.1 hypothetical protein AVJ23_17780 [Pseudoponticoccus marisrubri]
MPLRRLPVLLLSICAAGAVLAHGGVQNPAVKARMDLMVEVKDAMAVLGNMARGRTGFDPVAAEAARTALVGHAAEIPARFEAPETDPKTEALPAIWTDWPRFVATAEQMGTAAAALDTGSLDTLRAGLGPLGQSCSACHERFRKAD